jgi:putative ATPase
MGRPDLFGSQADKEHRHAPLAERMRPRHIGELLGQEDLLGADRLLKRAINEDRLPSMILWGPPGCGKTALAAVIAHTTNAEFVSVSAVMSGVREFREIFQAAKKRRDAWHTRTVLFLDEIHHLNKSQQDALLPHVERGTVTLIGATTENPSFELNAALLSRCTVFVLKPLSEEHLATLVRQALNDRERGLGDRGLAIDDEAVVDICRAAGGDARRVLNALEAAAEFLTAKGQTLITPAVVAEAAAHRTLRYDRASEEHYNVVSAFIKSLRGSDPDAAVYWMTRMLEAGEDPRFILRRMIIFASEDIGNADPRALSVATAACAAHEFVGLPESALNFSQAVCYLATAPKSNSALIAYARARRDVHERGHLPVPLHLRNAPTSLMRDLGYGKDYRYPHNFEGHYIVENYLPDALRGREYYAPVDSGFEREIADRMRSWKQAQEAAPANKPDGTGHEDDS